MVIKEKSKFGRGYWKTRTSPHDHINRFMDPHFTTVKSVFIEVYVTIV